MVDVNALIEVASNDYYDAKDDYEYYSCQEGASIDDDEHLYWGERVQFAIDRMNEADAEIHMLMFFDGK